MGNRLTAAASLLAPALALVSSNAVAEGSMAPNPACPSAIDVQQTLASPPAGWDSTDSQRNEPHQNRTASFYNGHPEAKGELKPSRIEASKPGAEKNLTHSYDFSGEYPDGIWLACGFDATSVMVFQRLPEVPVSCTVDYAHEPHMGRIVSIHCR